MARHVRHFHFNCLTRLKSYIYYFRAICKGAKFMRFQNREEAARLLARRLSADYINKNPLVLGVPRGAMSMAKIIADSLGGELDVVLVRKLGHPEQPELAIGAIDESGNVFLTDYASDIDAQYLEAEKQRQFQIHMTAS
jgi:putative phosphoribosyl transferase